MSIFLSHMILCNVYPFKWLDCLISCVTDIVYDVHKLFDNVEI